MEALSKNARFYWFLVEKEGPKIVYYTQRSSPATEEVAPRNIITFLTMGLKKAPFLFLVEVRPQPNHS